MVTGSVGGLILGVIAGMASHASDGGILNAASPYIVGAGRFWLNALSAVVVPLTVTNVIAAVLRGGDARQSGTLSAYSFMLFFVWLLIGAIFTLATVPMALHWIPVDATTVSDMVKSLPAEALVSAQAKPAPTSPADVADMLMSRNLLKTALDGELLPLLIAAITFAFAILRTSEESRETLTRVFRSIADALLVLVKWLVSLMPLGAFAMAFTFTESAGAGVAGILAQFTVLSSLAMIALTLLMYPLTWLASGVSMRQFAAGVLPAQVTALSTRSSLASLPALLEGGTRRLGLRPDVANLALPLSVAVFKVNRTTSSVVKLLFVAHIFNVDLSAMQLLTFTVTVMILSFTALGIPGGGGSWKSMAAYLAMGLPIEGYILMGAAEPIIDIFKTVLNVTGDLSVATVLDRRTKPAREVAPDVPDEALEAAA